MVPSLKVREEYEDVFAQFNKSKLYSEMEVAA